MFVERGLKKINSGGELFSKALLNLNTPIVLVKHFGDFLEKYREIRKIFYSYLLTLKLCIYLFIITSYYRPNSFVNLKLQFIIIIIQNKNQAHVFREPSRK